MKFKNLIYLWKIYEKRPKLNMAFLFEFNTNFIV